MNDKQIQQALQEIAAAQIPNDTDLWPEIATKVKWPSQPIIRQWGIRLAGTAVAIFALFLFATWFLSISQSPETDNAANGTTGVVPEEPTYELDPQLVYPDSPESLPRYEVELVPPPQTPEEMLAWADAFGMPDPKLFRSPSLPGRLLVVGRDGARLSFPTPESDKLEIRYIRSAWPEYFPGETISFDAGLAAAQSFLTQHAQLPSDYQVVEKNSTMINLDGYSVALFHFMPSLNGYALLQMPFTNTAVGAAVSVEADGTVSSAEFAEAIITEVDTVNVRPAEEVLADLINDLRHPTFSENGSTNLEWRNVRKYFPPLPEHTIGEVVTILETGDTHYLIAEDGSEVRATLGTAEGGHYELVSPDLAQIADTVGDDTLRVTGRIEAQLAPDAWRLAVESWEIIPKTDAAVTSGCAVGPVTVEADRAWVTGEPTMPGDDTSPTGRYYLENLPSAIQSGDRLEVCSWQLPDEGGTMPWAIIFSPPRDTFDNSSQVSNEYIIEAVQLVYYYNQQVPEQALATPSWMITGHTKDNTVRFIAFIDATQR
jgi:hypothetical protein